MVALVALFPAPSVAFSLIFFVPTPTSVHALSLHDALPILVGLQLSLTLTPPRTLGTVAWQFAPAKALGVAEQKTTGAKLCDITNPDAQVWLLTAASVAVTVIVVVPRPTRDPASGT